MSEIVLSTENLVKTYPGVVALNNVSIDFEKGEVHALLGENGAGKSTLIKALTGAVQLDSGKITFEGKSHNSFKPIQAMELGISAIYQEFNLINYFTVAENIFYGREILKGPFVCFKEMNDKTVDILKRINADINPKAQVSELSVAYKQLVEIAKALSQEAKVLIMDEPTAALSNAEVEDLMHLIEILKSQGVTIIYISHRLEEIFNIADRVTVMRDGQYIDTLNVKDTNRKDLINLMVGRELGETYPEKTYKSDDVLLEVKNLNTGMLKDVNFTLNKGEILGFGGLVGAGRTEVGRAIFGADAKKSGEVILNNQVLNINSPSEAIKNGIGLIPEDRKEQGVLLKMSIRENTSFPFINKFCKNTIVNRKKERIEVKKYFDKMRIKAPTMNQLVGNLSGGNQQKVVLAKWLVGDCEVLIFDEPTRGIDVGAKQEIYELITELANQGKGIIFISSEMPELLGMSDRVIVMHEGEITGVLDKTEVTQSLVLELASGQN